MWPQRIYSTVYFIPYRLSYSISRNSLYLIVYWKILQRLFKFLVPAVFWSYTTALGVFLIVCMASKSTKQTILPGTHAPEPAGARVGSWEQHQAYKKQHENGKARWRSEWEVVYYQEGDQRFDRVVLEGKSFFRHLPCGGEYSCRNMPRTVKEHDCSKAREPGKKMARSAEHLLKHDEVFGAVAWLRGSPFWHKLQSGC